MESDGIRPLMVHDLNHSQIKTENLSLVSHCYYIPMIIYRMEKIKSAESPYCNTSATSKACKDQWWKFELCNTSTMSKASRAKWWNFEPLTESLSLVWYPGKIIGTRTSSAWQCLTGTTSVLMSSWAGLRSGWVMCSGTMMRGGDLWPGHSSCWRRSLGWSRSSWTFNCSNT